MTHTSGLLSKISDSQYRLLTMDGEFLIEGNLSLYDGFHSNMDVSNVALSQIKPNQLISSETFSSSKLTSLKNGLNDCQCGECDECQCDCKSECACPAPSDD